MTHALTLTLPIKQDAESQAKLKHLGETFATDLQPKIEKALRESHIVHFARVVLIDNRYLQVITEYEGSHREYTELFRKELVGVFGALFSLTDYKGDVTDPNGFWEFAKSCNVRSLGNHTHGGLDFEGKVAGWLFSAYDHKDVRTIQAALDQVTDD